MPLNPPVDIISISELGEGDPSKPLIKSANSNIPLNEKNICFQAVAEFAKFANIPCPLEINIEKNIPVAAGLGGGSSDAAAVLKLLNKRFFNKDNGFLCDVAQSLGADVPFFINPTPSIGKGVGEKLTPVSGIPEIPLVILNPRFPVSAAWGYNNYIPNDNAFSVESLIEVLQNKDFEKLPEVFCNDLQAAVFRKFPIMEILRRKLLKSGAVFVGMSGSGPTIFGVCSSLEKAQETAKKVEGNFADAVYCIVSSTEGFKRL